MNNITLKGSRAEQLQDNRSVIQESEIQDTSIKTKLKILLSFFCLVLLLIISYPIIDSLLEPKPIPIPTDSQKLDSLIDKVVKGNPLSGDDWANLCDLLAVVKGININSCDSCHNYLRALLGGKHETFLRNYEKCADNELRKGIRSLQKQINYHLDKIANPKNHIKNWESLDVREQAGVLKKWQKDIDRQTEHKEIMNCILKNRKS